MSATSLFDAGYTELVSVIPPGGVLAESSRIKPAMLGKVPGKKTPDGWVGYKFTQEHPDREQVQRWESWGANIGLLGNQFPALDLDVEDETLATVLLKVAREILGPAPVRRSRGPRRLLVYHSAAPLGRVAARLAYRGRGHLVEVLGRGRQYLVEGAHPSGEMYRWEGPSLDLMRPEMLSEVTAEKVRAFYARIQELLTPRGVQFEMVGEAKEAGDAPPQDELKAPTLEELTRVVELLPNGEGAGWDQMIQMGYAIKAAGQDWEDEARDLFLAWCGKWEGGENDPEMDAYNWESLRGPFRAGWNWLQERAQATGGYLIDGDQFEFEEAPPPVADRPGEEEDQRLVPLTDEWVVHQILPRLRSRLRYIHVNKDWRIWAGHQWAPDGEMAHERLVRELLTVLARHLMTRGDEAPNPNQGKPLLAAARKIQSAAGIDAVIRLLRARVAASPGDFDVNLMELNTPGGVVDLMTGALRPVVPGQMYARSTGVAPVPGPGPLWKRFLADLTGGDLELMRYLQMMAGYALTGDMSEKTLWFIWGSDSDTGKSTYIRVLTEILGSYADTVDVGVFINTPGARTEALARLPGVRLVTATEPAAGHAWDEHRIKAITGGDVIEARALYGHPFTYSPQFKILVVGNHEPEIKTVDDAMLRRIHIVPFNRKVPKPKQVEGLSRILVEREGPQILQWMIEGCLAWQQGGLEPPAVVLAKNREYEQAEDSLGAWIDEECELGDFMSTKQELYAAWCVWCRMRGEDPGGLKAWGRRIYAKRLLNLRNTQAGGPSRRVKAFHGIRLRAEIERGDLV